MRRLLAVLTLVGALAGSPAAGFSNLTDAVPQLAGLEAGSPDTRPVALGGQDWKHCCLLAVNASLRFDAGTGAVRYGPSPFLDPLLVSPAELTREATRSASSFPCGATFGGDYDGAPEVRVPFAWCRGSCDGWQISHRAALTQWIGPLVGFILPCLAFCLNIPRRRKLSVPGWVLSPPPNNALAVFLYPVRLGVALLFVTVDTIGWLCLCFALAGPMLLSGVYETWIDMQLLHYLATRVIDGSKTDPVLTMKLRAQLLLLVVVGNIKIAGRGKERVFPEVMQIASGLEPENESRLHNVGHVKSKLFSLSSSQPSFGSAVGAPVVFFVGAFIYNMIDIQTRLGDNDTAHALAFGMWWMTIPFVAIISCLLLASNNPGSLHGILVAEIRAKRTWSILEGAYNGPYEPVDLWNRGPTKMHWFRKTVEQYEAMVAAAPANNAPDPGVAYEMGRLPRDHPGQNQYGQDPYGQNQYGQNPYGQSQYGQNPYGQSQYGQNPYGRNQHGQNGLNPYGQAPHGQPSASQVSQVSSNRRLEQLDNIKRKLKPNAGDWCLIFASAVVPLAASFVLAFITSFNTPRVGLACRSLTHLLYFLAQLLQMLAWMAGKRAVADEDGRPGLRERAKTVGILVVTVFLGAVAIFISVGGTLMQLIGVYRNCLCKVPVQYWLRTDDTEAYVLLGSNGAQSISNAQTFWMRTAGAATGILCAACALAWWFQRHLRTRYAELVWRMEVNPSW